MTSENSPLYKTRPCYALQVVPQGHICTPTKIALIGVDPDMSLSSQIGKAVSDRYYRL
jgi:hypothetical protein